ncbi:MAG: hypothetical protein CVV27_11575 [Candidatus Melainabacteria bacterium HGW-Melainabacteria-1]|nr:MAG: hypothetical protein CVV27_11575 [Candidatus Melainabacteria bacterium HGW-Melainabacteria-1]
MFRLVFVVPTGLGAAIGGYAGDAGLAVRYLGGIADQILTHPNAVNAAMFNVLPDNGLYLEGHALDQFFLGQLGFLPVASQRIGLVIDRRCEPWLNLIENAVHATAVSTGCQIAGYALTETAVELSIEASDYGYRGEVADLEPLLDAGRRCLAAGATALAVLTWMDVLEQSQIDRYWQGLGPDPIGALEALISHALVAELGVPVAHSPIFEPSIVSERLDPRVAAEEIGHSYLPCILMGLARAPRLVPYAESAFGRDEISALVIPEGACGGIPMLVAAERGIPVIVVKENKTVINVDFAALGWHAPHLYSVANLWEAGGLLQALKQGLDPALLRRPIKAPFQPI